MFKLVNERIAWIDVEWPGLALDGEAVTNKIEMQVVLIDRSALGDMAALDRTNDEAADFIVEVARDWRGVGEEGSDASLPMTRETVARMVEVPAFLGGFATSYGRAWAGQSERRGNSSAAAPENGRAAAPDKTTATGSKRRPRR